MSAGARFAAAFARAPLDGLDAQREVLAQLAGTIDRKLAHAREFATAALAIGEPRLQQSSSELAALANGEAGEPSDAAWSAGLHARAMYVAACVLAEVSFLRCSVPDHVALASKARARAEELTREAAQLEVELARTGVPLVTTNAPVFGKLIRARPALTPTKSHEYEALAILPHELLEAAIAIAHDFDAPPPTQATAPAGDAEHALLAQIFAAPHSDTPRRRYAELAATRDEPRAELVRVQLAVPPDERRAAQLVALHPEWTEQLRAHGARGITFARGFADEIEISATDFLAHGKALFAHSPLTGVRIRGASAAELRELFASPLLEKLARLDLVDQHVTDAELRVLAGSPYVMPMRELRLSRNPITAAGVDALASASRSALRSLLSVELDYRPASGALEVKYGRIAWLHPDSR